MKDFYSPTGIKIIGTGSFLPERIVTNKDFENIVETSDEWITTRTGIKTRHICETETVCSMGAEAAKRALDSAKLTAEDIDIVIGTTITNDFYTPSMACMVIRELGANNAFGYDIGAACSGFVYALDAAYRYIATGAAENILIVSSEMLSRITNYEDRATCVVFADGAGAAVVTRGSREFASCLRCAPGGTEHIYAATPDPVSPFFQSKLTHSFTDIGPNNIYMNGREVYKFAVRAMVESVRTVCSLAGAEVSDIDILIPHQANIRIIETAVSDLGLDKNKVLTNIDSKGNTSSATIPICMDEAARAGQIKPGDLAVMVGFGGGLTYGAALTRF